MTKKRILLSAVLSLILTSVLYFSCKAIYIQNEFDKSLYDNVLRFHVIANSNSAYDQDAKLQIKDALLDSIGSLTAECKDADEAYRLLSENLEYIKSLSQETAYSLGFDYKICVELKEEDYPVRFYDGFALPSGNYKSLIVNLGDANGKNWWCVLYPSVCESPASEFCELMTSAGVSEDAVGYLKASDGKNVKIYFFELFKKFLKGEDNGTQNFR